MGDYIGPSWINPGPKINSNGMKARNVNHGFIDQVQTTLICANHIYQTTFAQPRTQALWPERTVW